MAGKPVVDAVEARLAANWTTTPIIGVNLQGDTPSDGSAFVAVQYPVANEAHVGMAGVGQRTFRETGAFRIVINIARGQGVALGLQYAETLRSLFRAAQFSGVSCLAPSPAIEDNTNDNGNYYVLTFVVTYYFDLLA